MSQVYVKKDLTTYVNPYRKRLEKDGNEELIETRRVKFMKNGGNEEEFSVAFLVWPNFCEHFGAAL
jgi:hypothetical protein